VTCGTNGGYQQHRKHGEEACQPCKDANAAYVKEWRSRSGPAQEYARRYALAKNRATQRLLVQHASDFEMFLYEELRLLDREATAERRKA